MAKKWTRAADVIWEELDDGALLVDSKTGARWSLNATAAALWKWCDGGSTLNELALRLAENSRRNVREARAEVRSFCERFADRKLVVLVIAKNGSVHPQTVSFSALNAPASFSALGLGHGPRTRPGPRGNSSPG